MRLRSLDSDLLSSLSLVWSDDDWLKKFSGKTIEDAEVEVAGEGVKSAAQEVECALYCVELCNIRLETCYHLSLQAEPPAKKGRINPQVYMDIKIGNKPAGRLRFLLRADIVPMTAGLYVAMTCPFNTVDNIHSGKQLVFS